MQRYSKKREAILKTLRETKAHPCAEWIYNRLKPEFPDLSLGTVYRNISQFIETGDICCVTSINGQERYDADISRHAHFVCSCCGGIQDVFMPTDGLLLGMEDNLKGARVDNVMFRGLCTDCCSQEN